MALAPNHLLRNRLTRPHPHRPRTFVPPASPVPTVMLNSQRIPRQPYVWHHVALLKHVLLSYLLLPIYKLPYTLSFFFPRLKPPAYPPPSLGIVLRSLYHFTSNTPAHHPQSALHNRISNTPTLREAPDSARLPRTRQPAPT